MNQVSYVIKADTSVYIIFSIFIIPILLIELVALHKSLTALPLVLLTITIIFIVLLWISSFKIILKNDNIYYKSLFSKLRIVKLSDIKELKCIIGDVKRATKKSAFYQMVLYDYEHNELLTINMKPFSKNDITLLVKNIVLQKPDITIDKFFKAIIDGNFNPVIQEGVNKILILAFIIIFSFVVVVIIIILIKLLL